jgi:iron complex transport system substrate-binding protein
LNARERCSGRRGNFLEKIPSPPVHFARQKVTGFLIFRGKIWNAPAKSRRVGSDGALDISLSLWERVRVRALVRAVNPSPRPSPKGRGRKRRQATALRIFALALTTSLLFACSRPQSSCPSTSDTRVVVDEAGRQVRLPQKIDRIVSLAPNLTEIVYAVGAGDRLVGRTSYCDYPPAAKTVAEIGDTMQPSVERIIALKPQVVLISTASQLETFTKQLDEQRIAVYVTNPNSVDQVFRSIETLGQLFGTTDQAKQLAADLSRRTQAVEAAVANQPPIKVFYQISDEPLYTIGRDAFLTDLIRRAGGISVTADVPTAFPRYSDEAALASQPDAIILPTGGSIGNANSTAAPALRNSPAVRNNRVYKINDDILARPGPRLIDGLEQLARALHPEAFR